MNLPEPGQPGNPQGYSRPQLWKTALFRALNQKRDDGQGKQERALALIARSLINEALSGQRWAHEMIADRIDGPLLRQEANSAGITVIVNRLGLEPAEPLTIEGEAVRVEPSD